MNRYAEQLKAVLATAPKREDYQSPAEWEEANTSFRHRAAPSIRMLRFLASREQSRSQGTEK